MSPQIEMKCDSCRLMASLDPSIYPNCRDYSERNLKFQLNSGFISRESIPDVSTTCVEAVIQVDIIDHSAIFIVVSLRLSHCHRSYDGSLLLWVTRARDYDKASVKLLDTWDQALLPMDHDFDSE
ncbi:hypothetical protein TNIN_468651 [Trichonephila inaurata madagascariensis]|uniref:Uncharacterized protein n=1 Tax=Trichonephila inaurata madagascariensis TaxID=2747483 RepID=A0A8X6I7T4_9ARAC|nr:hypothetical protein TNIN_468651 [Trichonephila inaurata madagascariensis]